VDVGVVYSESLVELVVTDERELTLGWIVEIHEVDGLQAEVVEGLLELVLEV
jgi:hypothetical protein